MKTWKKGLAATAATLALAATSAPTAQAITGGQWDKANEYDNVGIIASYSDGGRYRCTATLVSPTVLLTAAHCTEGTDGKTVVSFEPVIAEQAPSNLPVASDPTVGYADPDGDGQVTDPIGRTWYTGTAYTHPGYSDFTDTANWNDVGVVILDQPITGIAPADIAEVGTLDSIPKSQLSSTLFRIVGYGTEVRKTEPTSDSANQGKKAAPQSYPIVRRYADAPGQKLTPQILQVNGNIHDTRGTGGSCFGDSGGPTFYPGGGVEGEQVVTVTSYGYTDNCRYIDGLQRVDIPVVQDWLMPIVESGVAPTEYYGKE